MKKFLLWVMVICMLMVMGMANVTAVADGTHTTDGALYSFEPANWPNKHWAFMSDEEISSYEEAGWIRETGVLWGYFDGISWTYTSDAEDVQASDAQDLYNKGYNFSVLYTWVCPSEILGTVNDQSVTVGQWVLSPDQTAEYLRTYEIPKFSLSTARAYNTYDSEWYVNGISADMTGDESEEELKGFSFVRYIYDTFEYGYGSKLFIRNGKAEVYTYEEAVEVNETAGFFNEMPKWH